MRDDKQPCTICQFTHVSFCPMLAARPPCGLRERLAYSLLRRCQQVAQARRPDERILSRYLLRWDLFKSRWCNVYLHLFIGPDTDRELHDHPWASMSLVLAGSYTEVLMDRERSLGQGAVVFRRASLAHRIEISDGDVPCWTLFITGPVRRVWGFRTPLGFVPHDKFRNLDGAKQDDA